MSAEPQQGAGGAMPSKLQSWAVAQIGEVSDINPRLDKSEITRDLEVSFVPMPAVEAETGKIDVSAKRLFVDVEKGYTGFKQGDVLFAKITPCMENGKMAVVPEVHGGLGFGSTEFHVLRPSNGIVAEYIYYHVSSKTFRANAEHNMTGAVGQRRVPTGFLAKAEIPIPPSAEQNRIVAKIEELFSELDEGIENLKQARTQLAVYRQALLKHAFEGKLTADWRAAHADKPGSISHPKERTAIPSETLATLPKLPTGWSYVRLGDVIEEPSYGTSKKCDYETTGVGVLRIPNVVAGSIDSADLKFASFSADEIRTYALKVGDLLMIRSNGSVSIVGRCARVTEAHTHLLYAGYLIRLRSLVAEVDSAFLHHQLGSHALRSQIERAAKSTSGVNNINSGEIRSLVVALCSPEEQRQIIAELEQSLAVVDALESDIDANLLKAETLRQSILKKAFAGELVPQDSADEPAAVLLARIRAERAAEAKEPKARPVRSRAPKSETAETVLP